MTPTSTRRLTSLDQFRGYTVVGMLLVNFLGGYAVCPKIWLHTHDYCSYADTIMPHFFFAVGFALRLSFLKHQQHGGGWEAWPRMLRRVLGLALVAIVWYSIGDYDGIQQMWSEKGWRFALFVCFKRVWFATLMHIAITTLWILPVILAPLKIRVLYAIGSGLLHVALSAWFNFAWVNGQLDGVNGIDGGPLGFLTWSIVALAGTWACDVCRSALAAETDRTSAMSSAVFRMLTVGWVIAGFGWLLSCGTTIYDVPADRVQQLSHEKFADDPVIPSPSRLAAWNRLPAELPFVPPPDVKQRQWNYWMMSQRSGSLSYLVFSAGFSLLVFAIFVWACEIRGWQFEVFRTFGVNALAGYLLADLTAPIAVRIMAVGQTSPALEVGAAFVIHLGLTWAILRLMEWRKVFLRM